MNRIPEQLGPYELFEEVGRGGMAVVHRVRDTRNGQILALKILPPEFAHNANFLSRFVKEGQNALRLRHKNIVRVFEASQAHGYYYIAMELATGGTVADLLKQCKAAMPLTEVLPIIQQVAAGLDYAHDHGFLHRDMKPSNILLTTDSRALIADFGVAREMTDEHTMVTMPGFSVGTPAYMSPEQALGEPNLDRRSDVYSLGVVAYAMLTGKLPFAGDSHLVLLRKVIDEFPTPPEVANPKLRGATAYVLKSVLAKNPDDRYARAGEFAAALVKAGTGTPAPYGEVPVDATLPSLPVPLGTSNPNRPRTASVPIPPPPVQAPVTASPPPPARSYGAVAMTLGIIAVALALAALLRPQFGGLFSGNLATPAATAQISQSTQLTLTVVNIVTSAPALENTPTAVPTARLTPTAKHELPVAQANTPTVTTPTVLPTSTPASIMTATQARVPPTLPATDIPLPPTPLQSVSAETFIRQYYELINRRDYALAWSQVSSHFKEVQKDTFSKFTNWYDSMSGVKVLSLAVLSETASVAKVKTTTRYIFTTGRSTDVGLLIELRKGTDETWQIYSIVVR